MFLILTVQACTSHDKVGEIEMSPLSDLTQFESRIDSLQIIPLKDNGKLVLGDELELCSGKDSWYLVDNKNKKIVRYSMDGSFCGMIGHRGRSSSEYLTIQNVQVLGDTIFVYSFPDKVVRYSADGIYIGSESVKNLGYQTFYRDDRFYSYHGYLMKGSYRLSIIDDGETKREYLRTKGRIMHFESIEPVFIDANNRLIMIDSYNNALYEVSENKCEEYLSFDFGQYSISKDFFKSKDEFEGAEYLLNTIFARISRYLENSKTKCVVVSLDGQGQRSFIYGLEQRGVWQWFQMGAPTESPFTGTLRLLDDDGLIFLLESKQLKDIPREISTRIIGGLDVDDIETEYVITKAYIH